MDPTSYNWYILTSLTESLYLKWFTGPAGWQNAAGPAFDT